jgi:hypothetical protein
VSPRLLKFPEPPKIVPPAGDQAFNTWVWGGHLYCNHNIMAWAPKAHSHLKTENAFSSSPRVPSGLTVPVLFKSLCTGSLRRLKALSQLEAL